MSKRERENLKTLKSHVLDDVEYTPRQVAFAKMGLVFGLIVPFVAMVLILFACVHWDLTISGSEKWVERYGKEVKKSSEREIKSVESEKDSVEIMNEDVEEAPAYVEEAL